MHWSIPNHWQHMVPLMIEMDVRLSKFTLAVKVCFLVSLSSKLQLSWRPVLSYDTYQGKCKLCMMWIDVTFFFYHRGVKNNTSLSKRKLCNDWINVSFFFFFFSFFFVYKRKVLRKQLWYNSLFVDHSSTNEQNYISIYF